MVAEESDAEDGPIVVGPGYCVPMNLPAGHL